MARTDITLTGDVDFSQGLRSTRKFAAQAQRMMNSNFNTRNIENGLGRISRKADEFTKSLEASNARVVAFGASLAIIEGARRTFDSLVRTIVNVEKKLADVNVVLNANSQTLNKFGKDLFNIARETGQSFNTVSEAAIELARQGLGLETTLKRVRDAMILVRLSGADVNLAVGAITATLNSFNETLIDSTTLVSKLASVDAAFAVSINDLAEGFSRSASSAKAAGVTIDELGAIITSVQQRTARGGAVIGNALKTIFARLETSTTLNGLKELGVQIDQTQTGIEKLQAIASRLSEKDLTPVDASKIKELAAGKRQINILNAAVEDLAQQYSIFNNALLVSVKATNEAISRNQKLNETLAALGNSIQQSLGKIFSQLGDTGIKDVLRDLLRFTDNFIKSLSGERVTAASTALQGLFDAIRGISNFGGGLAIKGILEILQGPGLAVGVMAFISVFKRTAGFLVSSVASLSGINNKLEAQKNAQLAINQLLRNASSYDRQRIRNATSLAQKEEYILNILARQQAMMASVRGGSIATPSTRGLRGLKINPDSGFVQGGKGTNFAGGGIGSALMREVMAISKGVGGASSSAKPKVIQNFSYGGGKRGPAVANTDEYIVRNFAGSGGDAIFNKEMISKMGVPEGAQKITGNFADSYIPNFASPNLRWAGIANRIGSGGFKDAFLVSYGKRKFVTARPHKDAGSAFGIPSSETKEEILAKEFLSKRVGSSVLNPLLEKHGISIVNPYGKLKRTLQRGYMGMDYVPNIFGDVFRNKKRGYSGANAFNLFDRGFNSLFFKYFRKSVLGKKRLSFPDLKSGNFGINDKGLEFLNKLQDRFENPNKSSFYMKQAFMDNPERLYKLFQKAGGKVSIFDPFVGGTERALRGYADIKGIPYAGGHIPNLASGNITNTDFIRNQVFEKLTKQFNLSAPITSEAQAIDIISRRIPGYRNAANAESYLGDLFEGQREINLKRAAKGVTKLDSPTAGLSQTAKGLTREQSAMVRGRLADQGIIVKSKTQLSSILAKPTEIISNPIAKPGIISSMEPNILAGMRDFARNNPGKIPSNLPREMLPVMAYIQQEQQVQRAQLQQAQRSAVAKEIQNIGNVSGGPAGRGVRDRRQFNLPVMREAERSRATMLALPAPRSPLQASTTVIPSGSTISMPQNPSDVFSKPLPKPAAMLGMSRDVLSDMREFARTNPGVIPGGLSREEMSTLLYIQQEQKNRRESGKVTGRASGRAGVRDRRAFIPGEERKKLYPVPSVQPSGDLMAMRAFATSDQRKREIISRMMAARRIPAGESYSMQELRQFPVMQSTGISQMENTTRATIAKNQRNQSARIPINSFLRGQNIEANINQIRDKVASGLRPNTTEISQLRGYLQRKFFEELPKDIKEAYKRGDSSTREKIKRNIRVHAGREIQQVVSSTYTDAFSRASAQFDKKSKGFLGSFINPERLAAKIAKKEGLVGENRERLMQTARNQSGQIMAMRNQRMMGAAFMLPMVIPFIQEGLASTGMSQQGQNITGGILGGAATGAFLGSMFGLHGMAIGAAGGAAFGGISSIDPRKITVESMRKLDEELKNITASFTEAANNAQLYLQSQSRLNAIYERGSFSQAEIAQLRREGASNLINLAASQPEIARRLASTTDPVETRQALLDLGRKQNEALSTPRFVRDTLALGIENNPESAKRQAQAIRSNLFQGLSENEINNLNPADIKLQELIIRFQFGKIGNMEGGFADGFISRRLSEIQAYLNASDDPDFDKIQKEQDKFIEMSSNFFRQIGGSEKYNALLESLNQGELSFKDFANSIDKMIPGFDEEAKQLQETLKLEKLKFNLQEAQLNLKQSFDKISSINFARAASNISIRNIAQSGALDNREAALDIGNLTSVEGLRARQLIQRQKLDQTFSNRSSEIEMEGLSGFRGVLSKFLETDITRDGVAERVMDLQGRLAGMSGSAAFSEIQSLLKNEGSEALLNELNGINRDMLTKLEHNNKENSKRNEILSKSQEIQREIAKRRAIDNAFGGTMIQSTEGNIGEAAGKLTKAAMMPQNTPAQIEARKRAMAEASLQLRNIQEGFNQNSAITGFNLNQFTNMGVETIARARAAANTRGIFENFTSQFLNRTQQQVINSKMTAFRNEAIQDPSMQGNPLLIERHVNAKMQQLLANPEQLNIIQGSGKIGAAELRERIVTDRLTDKQHRRFVELKGSMGAEQFKEIIEDPRNEKVLLQLFKGTLGSETVNTGIFRKNELDALGTMGLRIAEQRGAEIGVTRNDSKPEPKPEDMTPAQQLNSILLTTQSQQATLIQEMKDAYKTYMEAQKSIQESRKENAEAMKRVTELLSQISGKIEKGLTSDLEAIKKELTVTIKRSEDPYTDDQIAEIEAAIAKIEATLNGDVPRPPGTRGVRGGARN